MSETEPELIEEEREKLSDQSWHGHRKRQLRELGVDVQALDGDSDV